MKEHMYGQSSEDEPNNKKITENTALPFVKRGSVTEITIGDSTFPVVDPKKLEQLVVIIRRHDESLFLLRQRLKEQSTTINKLIQIVNTLEQDVQRLKEITNGYGSQEYTGI